MKHTLTLLAALLLAAACPADNTAAEEFRTMARDAVAAYLRYGYDAATGRFHGQLNVSDGSPRKPERVASAGEATIYQPGEYADLWEPLFPTHNCPMSMAFFFFRCSTWKPETNPT